MHILTVIFSYEKLFETKARKELRVIADGTISHIPFNFSTLWIRIILVSQRGEYRNPEKSRCLINGRSRAV